jgi:pyruvate formate lyase activating enzyme
MDRSTSLKQLLERKTAPGAAELCLPQGEGAVRCVACGHRCKILPGRSGVCRIRFNEDGVVKVPRGYVGALAVDPIEKKPFFHAFPGRNALSFGMLGCDYHCSYCQNWITSQALRDDRAVSPPRFCSADRLVDLAVQHGCPVITSTYNEPLITSEWAVEIFQEARSRGLTCSYVSNGNGTPEVLEYIRDYVDLYKVDLKGFDDRKYRSLGGTLQSVLDTIVLLKKLDFWIEIVTLIVPGFNDGDEELKQIADFIAGVSPDIPWHVTAFHPDYKMTDPPRTGVDALLRACDHGERAGLRYLYPGNLPGSVGDREHTHCPKCRSVLIERTGFYVVDNKMDGGKCRDCGEAIPGVWEPDAPASSDGAGFPMAVSL